MAYNIPADGRQVNDIGWYLDNKGTLISPWIDSGAEPGSGVGTNNPNGNVSGFWGTFHEPNANSFGQYINSISQQPVGKVGSFSLGQRPDAYMGLAQSPIIQQQLQNIATKSAQGYGGSLGRWQFGSTGNAPQTAPVGWGRNPGTPGAGQVAPWQATQYRSNWYEPGSGNGQNMGGGNGGNTGGGGGNNGGTGGTGNDGNQTVLPAGYGITAASGIGQGTTGHTTAYTGLLGGTAAPAGTQLLSKQNALATNRVPRDTATATDFTNQIMSAGTSADRPAGTVNMGQIMWAVNKAKADGNYTNWYDAWARYKDQYAPKKLSAGNNWNADGTHK